MVSRYNALRLLPCPHPQSGSLHASSPQNHLPCRAAMSMPAYPGSRPPAPGRWGTAARAPALRAACLPSCTAAESGERWRRPPVPPWPPPCKQYLALPVRPPIVCAIAQSLLGRTTPAKTREGLWELPVTVVLSLTHRCRSISSCRCCSASSCRRCCSSRSLAAARVRRSHARTASLQEARSNGLQHVLLGRQPSRTHKTSAAYSRGLCVSRPPT